MPGKFFAEFVKELQYLKGSSPRTTELCKRSFIPYKNICEDRLLTKALLNQFVVDMREHGYSITTCNITIRSINSFLYRLAENEHCPKLGSNNYRGKNGLSLIPTVLADDVEIIAVYLSKTAIS
jgi:hypothetical protein